MLGISPFGMVHTLISIVDLVAGIACFVQLGAISPRARSGQIYIAATVLSCLTGFFIFHHGGFGPAHKLGILTLGTFAVAAFAGRGSFGRASRYVETIAYSMTFLFNMIPTVTEGLTRLPAGAAIASGPDAPAVKLATLVVVTLFLAGTAYQVVRLRRPKAMLAAHA